MQPTVLPFLHFTDRDGSPLNGKVWFGLPNQNPETSPITVYWDRAGTQPASQPITVLNGFAMRTGTPGTLFANQAYSITVRNARGELVFYGADSALFDPASTSGTGGNQWVASGLTPAYNSGTSLIVPGDQTVDLHGGRRVRVLLGSGYVYGVISSSAFTSSTQVNMVLDGTSVLDASLSALDVSLLRADVEALPVLNYGKTQSVASAATVNLGLTYSNNITITGTATITSLGTAAEGLRRTVTAGGAFTLTHNAASLILPNSTSITATADDVFEFQSLGSGNWKCIAYDPFAGLPVATARLVPVRQTVLSGPVDASGFSAFGGSTLGTTVTATGALIVTAANGFDAYGQVNRVGSIANPSWTGLSTNGAMYLYLDIAADGSCTTGSTTLAPTYQWGGTYSTTSGQFTFNIQEMVGKVGNGATATQTFRVFVGEVTVAAGVVTAITWYALQGRYVSVDTTLTSVGATPVSFTHNMGMMTGVEIVVDLVNQIAEGGWTPGEVVQNTVGAYNSGSYVSTGPSVALTSRTNAVFVTGASYVASFVNKTVGIINSATAANWKLRMRARRNW